MEGISCLKKGRSSQFSTIADVLDGKNLAVEGPPGTGKSQTIVNTIAASLAQGKKVMFVAEKAAALEVVKSRLEKFGLGHFLLPLQATRSSKEQIISSIRDRIEAKFPDSPRELEGLKASFKKTRDDLGSYIQTLSSGFGGSGYTVHQILGRAISLRSVIDSLPKDLQSYNAPIAQNISKSEFDEILTLLKAVEDVWLETTKNDKWWKDIGLANIDPFSANEVLKLAEEVAKSHSYSTQLRAKLQEYETNIEATTSCLSTTESVVKSLSKNLKDSEINVIEGLNSQAALDDVERFLKDVANLRATKKDLSVTLKNPLADGIAYEIAKMADLLEKNNISSIIGSDLKQEISKRESDLSCLKEALNFLHRARKVSENLAEIPAKHIVNASKILEKISRDALLLRSESLIDPIAQVVVEKGHKHVDSLNKQRELLKGKISLTTTIKKDEVSQNLLVLIESGIFGIFSSKYRQAKKFYDKISCDRKFSKSQAAVNLKELEIWLSEIDKLNSNQKLQSLLGVRFDGLETKFEPYFEVFAYFASIDQNLSHPDCFALKNLLRSGSSDVLFSFPKISHDHPINLFQDINIEVGEALICRLEAELSDAKQAVNYIEKTADNLCERDGWSVDKLCTLSNEISIFQTSWKKASDDNATRQLLGEMFTGAETKHEDLNIVLQTASKIVAMEQRSSIILAIKKKQLDEFCNALNLVLSADQDAAVLLEKLSKLTNTNSEIWSKNKTHTQIANYMDKASQDKSGLVAFSYLVGIAKDVSARGYGDFIEKVFKNYTPSCDIAQIFKAVLARSIAQEVYKKYGSILSKFNGIKLSSLRKQLAELDVKIIELSREYLQAKLYREARPPQGEKGSGRKSEYTNMELLRNEVAKSQRYLPMREITKRAGRALIELKPCWMMSPLAVSNYIPKDTIEFDLVIIDEASQMTPENSIGALLRAKQVMVVGDVNQLPPSNFFGKIFDDEEENKDEATTEASILEMASSVFSPRRRLRWHYRSRHSGLISFSNRHIYDNDLVVFPSANESNPEMGVSYKKVDAMYSSGVNPEEAKAMVDAILDFMTKYPNKSLGVVVMNQKQASLLSDEMNYAFEKNPLAQEYREKWQDGLESFFIKNLENVQGDERDVIFIGTVYGPEKAGSPVRQGFGPINGVAGKRRLNVLFSRAKERIVTFSSMNTSDIKAEEDSGNEGAYMLKQWIEYCATGRIHSGKITNKDTDSEFEDHVVQQIRSIGCDAIPQVGVVGYSIDIGVKHPDWPHGFIMGVECDGATYHSSKSARDRDRLRQQVLEGLGWNLYRIWSTDWFDDPIRETEKLREAIKNRISNLKSAMIS